MRNRKKLSILLASVLCIAMLFASCGTTPATTGSSAAVTESPAAATGGTIKIGVIMPITGQVATTWMDAAETRIKGRF